jgi:hypothetical protein
MNEFKYEAIFCLGKYYKNILNDNKRALKCFQKVYELCGNLNICGLELVDSLLNDNKEVIFLVYISCLVIIVVNFVGYCF